MCNSIVLLSMADPTLKEKGVIALKDLQAGECSLSVDEIQKLQKIPELRTVENCFQLMAKFENKNPKQLGVVNIQGLGAKLFRQVVEVNTRYLGSGKYKLNTPTYHCSNRENVPKISGWRFRGSIKGNEERRKSYENVSEDPKLLSVAEEGLNMPFRNLQFLNNPTEVKEPVVVKTKG
ncbi:hypothetical protein BGZ49_000622 [Haplosporangium sp. Z 27]|nr:hypothetical protein BGZ49_000622 [Haplosporangium sp. Z 27]